MRLVTIIGLFRCAFKGAGLGFKDVVRTSRAWELFLLRALFQLAYSENSLPGGVGASGWGLVVEQTAPARGQGLGLRA